MKKLFQLCFLLLSVVFTMQFSSNQAAAAGPADFYLAIGDSLTFGYQEELYNQQIATGTYNPADFNDGYDTVFWNYLKNVNPNIQRVNLACVGETTHTFIYGGCPHHSASEPLHNDYNPNASQLQVTVAFLQAYRDKISPITLTLGSNDALQFYAACRQQEDTSECLRNNTPQVLSTFQQNYAKILDDIKGAAPSADIIVVVTPNPLVLRPSAQGLIQGMRSIQINEAQARNLKVADTSGLFTYRTICDYTNICRSPSDIHPSTAGYAAMAAEVWTASGYATIPRL